jgi:hypothetical protein
MGVVIAQFHEGSARTIIIEVSASARQTWRGCFNVPNGPSELAAANLEPVD